MEREGLARLFCAKINYLAHSLQLMQCLCVSKLNLFISIGTSLGRRTEICNIFSKFELRN